jgi:hypothetical protein
MTEFILNQVKQVSKQLGRPKLLQTPLLQILRLNPECKWKKNHYCCWFAAVGLYVNRRIQIDLFPCKELYDLDRI